MKKPALFLVPLLLSCQCTPPHQSPPPPAPEPALETPAQQIYTPPMRSPSASFGGSALTMPGGFGSIEIAPDGTMTAIDLDGRIWRFNLETGEKVGSPIKTAGAREYAFSPDQKYLITGGGRSIASWDLSGSAPRSLGNLFVEHVTDIAFSPTGEYALASFTSGNVSRIDPTKGTIKGELYRTARTRMLAFFPGGSRVAMLNGKSVFIWEMNPPKPLKELTVQGETTANHDLIEMTISSDGKHIAAGDYNARVSVWNTDTSALEHNLTALDGNTSALAYSPDGKYLALGERDGTTVWDMQSGRKVLTLTNYPVLGGSLAFSADGKYLYASTRGAIKRFNIPSGEEAPYGISRVERLLGASPDKRMLALAMEDASLVLFDIQEKKASKTWTGAGNVKAFRFAEPKGYVAARTMQPRNDFVGNHPDDIEVFDPETGKTLHRLTGHAERIDSIAFSPDGAHLASGGGDNHPGGDTDVRYWDLKTGSLVARWPSGKQGIIDEVSLLRFSADGKWLFSSKDACQKRFDVQKPNDPGQEIGQASGIALDIHSSRVVFSGGYSGIWVYDGDKANLVVQRNGSPIPYVYALSLAPNGDVAFVAESEGIYRFSAKANTYQHVTGLPSSDRARDVLALSQNAFAVLTWSGLLLVYSEE